MFLSPLLNPKYGEEMERAKALNEQHKLQGTCQMPTLAATRLILSEFCR